MQLRRPILLHILLEDGMVIIKSQSSPNIRTTNGERLVIYMNRRGICLSSLSMENILLLEVTLIPAGEISFSYNVVIKQFNKIILGLQLKFGISTRDLLEQPTHLEMKNILILFCFLSIPTFAFK